MSVSSSDTDSSSSPASSPISLTSVSSTSSHDHSIKLSSSFPSSRPRASSHRTRAPSPDFLVRTPQDLDLGLDPAVLVGKTLVRVRRSSAHPVLTLHFADGSAYQVRVLGYNPHPAHRGVPKELETSSPILSTPNTRDIHLTVAHAAMITMADRAFQNGAGGASASGTTRDSKWTQNHAAFAIKFVEEPGWHCVSATLAEYGGADRARCVFRNFTDVYLDVVQPPSSSSSPPPSPQKPAHQKRHTHRRANSSAAAVVQARPQQQEAEREARVVHDDRTPGHKSVPSTPSKHRHRRRGGGAGGNGKVERPRL